MTAAETFIDTLQQQPWYTQVEAAFAQAGVADPLWESTLLSEDASLNVAQDTLESDGSHSYGLFQLNSRGVGSGYALATLDDPVQNARIAAAKMGAALTASGATSSTPLDAQLQVIELAGWNGSLSEDKTRQSNLADVENTSGIGSNVNRTIRNFFANPGQTAKNATASAGSALGFPSSDQITTWLQQAAIGSVLLGAVAGGFALLAAPTIEAAAPAAAAAAL